ncbi:MAG: hypothetical protein D6733_05660 [Methanobacteriota archaeon]|nr:MAG: hypothetical protein D6733_05660 [Euryarchaeota archaeon]
MAEVTLDMVYEEIKNLKASVEEFMEKSLNNLLPEEEISDEEWEELKEIKEEGEYLSIEKVKRG